MAKIELPVLAGQCLDHLLIVSEVHLRHVLTASIQYYNSDPRQRVAVFAPYGSRAMRLRWPRRA